MNLYGSRFTYAGTSSWTYGLMFANVEDDEFVSLTGEIEPANIYNTGERKSYIVGENYEDSPVSFDISIVTEHGNKIDKTKLREIERWLFYRSNYYKLYLDPSCGNSDQVEIIDGVEKALYMNCRFINPQKIEHNDGIVGFKCTLQCDSHLMWQDKIEKTLTPSSSGYVSVDVDTDIAGYTYPRVIVSMGSSANALTIVNETDSDVRMTQFTGLSASTRLTIDGNINYVSGNNYTKFSTRNFVRLLPGTNKIYVSGDVTSIKFEWQNRRYFL